jgi:hypothetical protein
MKALRTTVRAGFAGLGILRIGPFWALVRVLWSADFESSTNNSLDVAP